MLAEATIDLEQGLVGDKWWRARGSSREGQITMMNSRAIAAIAGGEHAWPPAGDQFFVDLDLSVANLPSGTRLEVGSALLEVSETPHLGCNKFAARYGSDAVEFVNSPVGVNLRLRGLNAKVIEPGVVRLGDRVSVRRSDQS